MVLAGAILLRLQIRDTKKAHDPSEASLTMSQRRAVRRILQIRLAQLLSNSTTTPTPTPAPLDLTLSPHSHSFLNPSSSSIDPLSPPTEPRSYFPLSPNLPIPSIFLGALFSLLTLLALGVGLYDFLRCSRCLEHFDHFGAISASEGFGHGPINPSSSAGAGAGAEPGSTQVVVESGVPEGYDAAKAVEAHSGRVVHLTTVLIAGSILIVAVLFVIDEFLS
ncbi:unnamed protein product [Tilletia caries]|nr:unnamed protein product [Tilletia caries]CAD6955355.1 unnamed protein product [Tilletia controversa]